MKVSKKRNSATASLPPHLCHRISATASCLLRSAEENALLREQLAAKDKQNADKDKQIAELMAQVSLAKSGHRIIGIWDEHGQAPRHRGVRGAPGWRLLPQRDRQQDDPQRRLAHRVHERGGREEAHLPAHKAVSADITVVGLHTSVDKKKVRAVFMGPKGGTYILTEKAKTVVKDGDYEPMDKAEVNKRIEAHDAWLASSPYQIG